ncbi:MAG: hypothetical protein IJJ63_01925, partial [Bacilli bacterium]|nr:hypothetical protein [Bacilli bacterium]
MNLIMKNYFKGVLVLLFALLFMPTYADALTNINRIDLNYSVKKPLIDGLSFHDDDLDTSFVFNYDSSAPYYMEIYDDYYVLNSMWYCPYNDGRKCPINEARLVDELKFGYYTYASIEVDAKDGYDFDENNLDKIEVYINGEKLKDSDRTTPESLELQQLFAKMADEGVEYVVMEVSSQSLKLHRVDG